MGIEWTPIGVQCLLTSSPGEFPGYWDWLWYPGLSVVLVSIHLQSIAQLKDMYFLIAGNLGIKELIVHEDKKLGLHVYV